LSHLKEIIIKRKTNLSLAVIPIPMLSKLVRRKFAQLQTFLSSLIIYVFVFIIKAFPSAALQLAGFYTKKGAHVFVRG
jgi:hypothetical protein